MSAKIHFNAQCRANQQGMALMLTFLLMLVLAGLALAIGVFAHNSLVTASTQLWDKQAFYCAEAGWQRARQALSAGTWAPAVSPGSTNTENLPSSGTAMCAYTVTLLHNANNTYTLTSNGYVPNTTAVQAQRQVSETSITPSASGTNFSSGSTASASSSNASHPASDAIDGNTSSYWEANTADNNQYLSLNFGSAKTTSFLVLTEKDNRINTISVESSSDGSTWTAIPSASAVESPSKTWHVAFPAVTKQYLRVKFTDVNSGKKPNIKEWESYGATTYDHQTFSTSL